MYARYWINETEGFNHITRDVEYPRCMICMCHMIYNMYTKSWYVELMVNTIVVVGVLWIKITVMVCLPWLSQGMGYRYMTAAEIVGTVAPPPHHAAVSSLLVVTTRYILYSVMDGCGLLVV